MRVISVGGSQKGAGKTTLAAFLLKRFPTYGALKVTVCVGACPRPDPCGVCERLQEPFAIIEDEAILNTAGTDTARLMAAGAERVIWLQATEKGLATGIEAALKRLSDLPGLITEGNHFIAAYKPDTSLLVLGVGVTDFKPSAEKIFNEVDLLVVNHRGPEKSHELLQLQSTLPPQLAGKPIYLVEPQKSESIDNEIFLTHLQP